MWTKQDYAGGPITRDNTGVEVYGTIFAFEPSPLRTGLLWAGSDDGLVHLSKDDGENWEPVTPKRMPEWGQVNSIELSSHDAGRAFLAVTRYRLDDFTPLHLPHRRLRAELEPAHRRQERHPARPLRARGARGSRAEGTALRRDGVRDLRLLRRRRPLAAAAAQPAGDAGHRPGGQATATWSWRPRAAPSGSSTTSRRCGR